MTDASTAYKKLHERLKRIRAKTLVILRKSSEHADDEKEAEVRRKLDQD